MNTKGSIGLGRSIVLAVIAAGAIFAGIHAILADSVTTPAKFGGDYRVHGTDTVLVGAGWILMGLAITAKITFDRRGGHAGSVIAVVLVIIGGLFWLAVM